MALHSIIRQLHLNQEAQDAGNTVSLIMKHQSNYLFCKRDHLQIDCALCLRPWLKAENQVPLLYLY